LGAYLHPIDQCTHLYYSPPLPAGVKEIGEK